MEKEKETQHHQQTSNICLLEKMCNIYAVKDWRLLWNIEWSLIVGCPWRRDRVMVLCLLLLRKGIIIPTTKMTEMNVYFMALFGGEKVHGCQDATRYRIHALDWYWSLGTSQCDRFFVCFHKTLIYSIHTAGSWYTCFSFLIYCLLLMQTGRCWNTNTVSLSDLTRDVWHGLLSRGLGSISGSGINMHGPRT